MTQDLKNLEATSNVLDIVKWMSERIETGMKNGQDVTIHKHIRNKITDIYLHSNEIARENELLKGQIQKLYNEQEKLEKGIKDVIAQRDALQSLTETF